MTIVLMVAVIEFAEYLPYSLCLMDNYHSFDGLSFGFAFVKIVMNNWSYVVVLELAPEPAIDAKRLKFGS